MTGAASPETTSIESCIVTIRGQRVLVDADLARIYGVSTKHPNQQVKRNLHRFPPDFMWRLLPEEKEELVTLCDQFKKLVHSRVMPRVFTEHGAIMVASVLSSPRATEMSVFVVRAFVRYRQILAHHSEFEERLAELEGRVADHDDSIRALVAALRRLFHDDPGERPRPIGFRSR